MHTNCSGQDRFFVRFQAGAGQSKADNKARPLPCITAMPKDPMRPSLEFFRRKNSVSLPPKDCLLD